VAQLGTAHGPATKVCEGGFDVRKGAKTAISVKNIIIKAPAMPILFFTKSLS